MEKYDLKELVKPLKRKLPQRAKVHIDAHAKMSHRSFTSVRSSEYMDRDIRVETTYKITIDGKPFGTHVGVLNDGRVYCHALPQYSFPSAIGMIKKIIRTYHDFDMPEDELRKNYQKPKTSKK
ncbi:MAG: hypothetical protein OEQ53_10395 [Saprospiraceae bacterium]|nr:hypothetical protein [Saprospiraceae bacterium]